MATQTPKPNPKTDPVADAVESQEAAVERAIELRGKAGETYLSSYERVVLSLADSYEQAAGATKVGWVAEIAAVQADLTRGLTKAYASAARDFVSA